MYIRSQTSMERTRFLLSVTVKVGVCNALRTSQLFNTPNMSRSAYRASVNPQDCVACGRCVEVCPAGAKKLGQKLCKKDGGKIEYPKHELPDNTKWGPEKWIRTIEIISVSTAMIQVQHHVRQHVRHTFRFRDM